MMMGDRPGGRPIPHRGVPPVCARHRHLANALLRFPLSSIPMDLRQLAALVAVADTGTFSAAADALHTVQSNISTHVARLERELGATLVDRAAGRLTEEGELVVARARRIHAELDALAADVTSLRADVAGATRLGMIGTTGRWLVPAVLVAMETRHPKVKVTVLEGNTTN